MLISELDTHRVHFGFADGHELETQVLLPGDLGYVLAELINKIAEVERMLKALIKSLEKKLGPLNP